MRDPQAIAEQLERTFNKIHLENMQGIPLLNSAIRVDALGFQYLEDRLIGIIITPWLMNVVILPTQEEDWSNMNLGDKRPHKFQAKTYKFMFNEIDGIGYCQTHSLYSPMKEFASHDQAVGAAQGFLDSLMQESELTEEDLVDEELLGKVLRGEDTPEINLDVCKVIEPFQDDLIPPGDHPAPAAKVASKISRRNLLRGNLS